MRGLCANGIPFNVLRNPQFCEMITAINNAPKGYKAPSYEKARTVLLDECKRDVEKDLAMIKDTWYTQGVSIVSDGWSNVKHRPLINVIAANSRGAMFIEALATTIVLKSWKEWKKNGDEKMRTMGALVAETISDDEFWEEVENIVAIAKSLFYDHHYLETPAPRGVPRKAPNLDKEVVLGVMDAFGRIAENGAEQKLLHEQFAIFHMKQGIYNMPAAQIDAVTMDSIDWWSTYGSETLELTEVAKKFTQQPDPVEFQRANSKLFREYIGAESESIKLSHVPINSGVDFHFILSFAIDYTSLENPSPTNGKFKAFWHLAMSPLKKLP
ncbi:hypothetical protein GH714_013512 [Hevea brasiliensis]|uniref:DUF659 domain-containing protein n=1 Tax=Hevea brasiliensis TaxID=3981 RepID=A0A6A6LIY1_HEVBR|nr:hypothetical protein GH714_013512 [Hevea brasiliensis]